MTQLDKTQAQIIALEYAAGLLLAELWGEWVHDALADIDILPDFEDNAPYDAAVKMLEEPMCAILDDLLDKLMAIKGFDNLHRNFQGFMVARRLKAILAAQPESDDKTQALELLPLLSRYTLNRAHSAGLERYAFPIDGTTTSAGIAAALRMYSRAINKNF